ncbi:MAG: hypothetical protein LC791_20070 [Acidobacteria bacterium]|nr:hypothetical protein [Acidobacteriota bacterium]
MKRSLFLIAGCLTAVVACEPHARDLARPGSRVWLHAHNCYPEQGRWSDRLDRALSLGVPTAIEQDLVWSVDPVSKRGRSVISHEIELQGGEPTLEEHFFARIGPQLERALTENQRNTWPVLVLHLDFKTNEPEHHDAIWELLGKYERWLTTAERVTDERRAMPLEVGPLLVLTENGTGQAARFHDHVPVGSRLRLFGTLPSPDLGSNRAPEERAAAAIAASPAELIPSGPTNYRRWTNFAWDVVEHGGQSSAADWTSQDAERLGALVSRAHDQGLWIRFFTLNGHEPGRGDGWTEGYNFRSLDAVRARWRAAIDAGVDFIGTDQYEGLAALLE